MGSIATVAEGEAGSTESITVADTAIGFTTSKILVDSQVGPVKASRAVFKIETAPVRFTEDGTAPVASTTGILASIGDIVTIDGKENVAAFRAIRDTSTSGVIKPTYYR